MDLEHISISHDLVALSGNTLNIEKNSLLQSSLTVLLNDNHFGKVYFWGKIFGLDADYYIAFGYHKDLLRHPIYYYSKNAVDWVMLPKPTKTDYFLCQIITTRFMGDPSLQTNVVDDKPTEENPIPKEPLKVEERNLYWRKHPTYILKEEDRIAATVKLINKQGIVVPRGALYKQPNGDIVHNESWYGMNFEDSRLLTSYFHFRKPENRWDENVTKKPNYNYAYDFMDPIDGDIPLHFAWSCQVVNTNRTAILRSLTWPGAVSYNVLESPVWGFLYFGPAKKNIDIPFMI
uniref:Radial spoke head protein 9 homolog n=1 Tax=Lygus hesperus TaxID=30085 RepID=A0A0A9YFS0_LYGHE